MKTMWTTDAVRKLYDEIERLRRMVEREQAMRVEIMRLKRLVRDYDKELEASLDVWGIMAEVTGHWSKYDKLHERANELKAIGKESK